MQVIPSKLSIVMYPDPVLRKKALPVAAVNDEVREVAARMIQLMHEAEGVGLAAPQVGLPWRMFVAWVPESEDRSATSIPPTALPIPQVYINPVLSNYIGDLESAEEGCLSLPDIRGDVFRPGAVTISAMGVDGRPFVQSAAGLLARCWQHEMDHLDGTLILDRMTQSSRLRTRAAVRELVRRSEKKR